MSATRYEAKYGSPVPVVTIEETRCVIYVSVDRHYGTGPEFAGSYPTYPGSYDGPHRARNLEEARRKAQERRAEILRPFLALQRPCEGCGAPAGEDCDPFCLSHEEA